MWENIFKSFSAHFIMVTPRGIFSLQIIYFLENATVFQNHKHMNTKSTKNIKRLGRVF